MSDIVERAEEALAGEWLRPQSSTGLCYITSELLAELKAARAENERLHKQIECRHLGGIESLDCLPPILTCLQCGLNVSEQYL